MVRQNRGSWPILKLAGRLILEPGTCFVVIAMRNMFVEGELPGETPSRSAGSDISSFTELYQNALDVYSTCGAPEVNQPGWYPAGKASISFHQTVSSVPHHFGLTELAVQVT